jgi:hypothetical protein
MRSFEFREHQFCFPVLFLMFLLGIFPRLPTSAFEKTGMLSTISRLHPKAGFQRALAIEPQQAEFVALQSEIQKALNAPAIPK